MILTHKKCTCCEYLAIWVNKMKRLKIVINACTLFWYKCWLTYQLSKTLKSKEVEIPPTTRPHNNIQKLAVNLIAQLIPYNIQNTKVIFFRPNLSANGPVKVPNVDDDPKPAKNSNAMIFSAKP